MRQLTNRVSIALVFAIAGFGCAPSDPERAKPEQTKPVRAEPEARVERARRPERVARKPPFRTAGTRHISTWDAELSAVGEVLARLEPKLGRLDIGGTGPMSLRVVSRAMARPEDAEVLAAGDTCSTSESRIVCTDQAITSIVGPRSQRLHPVLLFLIAHELDHIKHGDRRQFAMPPLRIEAHATADKIVSDVRTSACAERRTDEGRADDFARDVVGRAIAAGAFSQGGEDLGLTAVWVLNTMFEGATRVSQGGDHSTQPLLESTDPPTPEQIASLSKRVLCLIAPGQKHEVVWQGFPGGYDTEGVRLTRTTERLEDELAHGGYGVAAHAGNLPELLRSLVDIQRVLMRQNADLITGVAAKVCEQMKSVADPWQGLSCRSSPHDAGQHPAPPRTCPMLEAPAAGAPSTVRTTSSGAPVIVARGNELHLTEPVTAIAMRTTGDVIATIGDRGQIVTWRAPGSPTVIGEVGCHVGGIAEVGAALVAVCSRGESIVRLEAGQRTTTQLATLRVGGEPDIPSHVQVSWVGSVANHVLAAVSQLGSGEGRLVEVTHEGLRSAAAWTGAGCDALGFSVRVASVDGTLWATPAHPAITPQLLRLSDGIDRVVAQLRPDDARVEAAIHGHARGNIPIMTCHASASRHVPLCTAMDGVFVDARKPMARRLATIVPAESWAPGSVTVRSCGTTRADYLMVIERDARARVFQLPARAAQAKQIWQAAVDTDSADLVCGDVTAALFVRTMDASTIVVLGEAP